MRWFLRLRNRVVHGDPYERMPSREELELDIRTLQAQAFSLAEAPTLPFPYIRER